jgi:hypothetical protein
MPELKFSDAELQIIANKVATIMKHSRKEAPQQLKEDDPQTSVTESMVRRLALSGKIKTQVLGQKRLINYDSLLEYLSSVHTDPEPKPIEYGKIRPIKE